MFGEKGYRFARNAYYLLKGYDADRFSAPIFRIKSVNDVYKLYKISESSVVNFILPLEKCVWGAGFRFSTETHPFAKAMISNNAFDVLNNFYSKYTPANIFDLFLIEVNNGSSIGKNLNAPWRKSSKLKSIGEGGIPIDEGVQHYGPCSDKKVKFEAKRCKFIYEKIESEGYWPQRYAGYPRGFFLVSGDDFLFQVGSGQHRLAALAAHGWEQVQCTSWKQSIGIVEASKVESWPGVRDGRVKSKDAIKIFEKNFSEELKIQHLELLN